MQFMKKHWIQCAEKVNLSKNESNPTLKPLK
jgi:hypothetical protein